ncbi:hypothetical protein GSI_07993 [Ganoderma sinense ZZ0214-1]|uniref:Transporter n=1 Tax=Ganoderma sinense ZZ0214-1 TaxID=1077348 RepID=A0A2G8S7T3_9APHY|nr:hypothetical protein GSI_07993 [Ganoderma sinense ZZ0214-1]
MSADVLSKHLILPLISMSHLAFSSADPLSTTSEADLEKSVDKVGRTARRTLDTHVRNALSRPLLATTLRRITAMFNFVPDLPRIVAASETPDLTPPSPPAPSRAPPASKPPLSWRLSPSPPTNQAGPIRETHSQTKGTCQETKRTQLPQDDDSVTEEEPEEEEYAAMSAKTKAPTGDHPRANTRDSSPARSVPSKRVTPDQSPPPKSRDRTSARQSPQPQPQSSSPLPAPKKVKRGKAADSLSDEEDSEEERKRHLARLKGSGPNRGAKQPLKRGGRRF